MTPLTRSQTREATALLVAAFDEDPYFNFLTPEKAEREVFVGAVMGTNLVLGYPREATYAVQAPELRGVCIWFAPGGYPIPFAEQARARAVAIGRALAAGHAKPATIARAMRMGELLDEAHPDEPCFYLQVLAVDPRHHGRGIGSSMLEVCCAQADAARLPAVLETSKEMNARLYRRFGFQTIRTTVAEGSPAIWTMRRDPRSLS
ncbi:MAG: GNAT family N-acetyltransferase [Sandaracinaceae bacterium]|nr:GNAT family N-acetyltransferase [Sandaracinaceae bacterium]